MPSGRSSKTIRARAGSTGCRFIRTAGPRLSRGPPLVHDLPLRRRQAAALGRHPAAARPTRRSRRRYASGTTRTATAAWTTTSSTPTELPGTVLTYHGQNWLDDLSLLAPAQGGQDVWRLAPSGFDAHGNPIFKTWKKVLTDPIFVARSAGTADALHGGNELADKFTSDWMGADGSPERASTCRPAAARTSAPTKGRSTRSRATCPTARRLRAQMAHRPHRARDARQARRNVRRRCAFSGRSTACSAWSISRAAASCFTPTTACTWTRSSPTAAASIQQTAGIYPQPGEFFAGQVVPNRDERQHLSRDGQIHAAACSRSKAGR